MSHLRWRLLAGLPLSGEVDHRRRAGLPPRPAPLLFPLVPPSVDFDDSSEPPLPTVPCAGAVVIAAQPLSTLLSPLPVADSARGDADEAGTARVERVEGGVGVEEEVGGEGGVEGGGGGEEGVSAERRGEEGGRAKGGWEQRGEGERRGVVRGEGLREDDGAEVVTEDGAEQVVGAVEGEGSGAIAEATLLRVEGRRGGGEGGGRGGCAVGGVGSVSRSCGR